jgi:hypothetical protein
MYKDIEENLAAQRNEEYSDKDKWLNGLPIGLELSGTGKFVSRL